MIFDENWTCGSLQESHMISIAVWSVDAINHCD